MTHAEQEERRQRMAEAVRKGADPRQVAMDEHVDFSTVYVACRAAGVKTYHRVRRASLPPLKREFHAVSIQRAFDILVMLRQTDKSLRQIAVVVGVRRQRVSQIATMAMEAGLLSPREDVKCTDTTKS